ncbi:MAG TPA: hypothetical protein VGA52_10030 [Anaerolineales bacterium]|jgi:hypothetical protein
MVQLTSTLLNLLKPPYGWILLVLLGMPYWLIFFSVLMSRLSASEESGVLRLRRFEPSGALAEKDLARYSALLTATWLLVVAFKVYQQYFVSVPLPNTQLGAFEFGMGLFSLASWAALLALRAQSRLQA